jgi:hypothetical protein
MAVHVAMALWATRKSFIVVGFIDELFTLMRILKFVYKYVRFMSLILKKSF